VRRVAFGSFGSFRVSRAFQGASGIRGFRGQGFQGFQGQTKASRGFPGLSAKPPRVQHAHPANPDGVPGAASVPAIGRPPSFDHTSLLQNSSEGDSPGRSGGNVAFLGSKGAEKGPKRRNMPQIRSCFTGPRLCQVGFWRVLQVGHTRPKTIFALFSITSTPLLSPTSLTPFYADGQNGCSASRDATYRGPAQDYPRKFKT